MSLTLEKVKELMQVEELPGNEQQIQRLLKATESLIQDHGEEWITNNRHRLLYEWEFCVQN